MCLKMSMKQVIVEGLCIKLSDFFRQLDVKLFGGYIVLYMYVCMCVEVSLKQSIGNELCMKLFIFKAA